MCRHLHHLSSCSLFGGMVFHPFLFCPSSAQTRPLDPTECSRLALYRKHHLLPYKTHAPRVIPCTKSTPRLEGPIGSWWLESCVEHLVCVHFLSTFRSNCSPAHCSQSEPSKPVKCASVTMYIAQKLQIMPSAVMDKCVRRKSGGFPAGFTSSRS